MSKHSWQIHKWTLFAGAAGAVPAFVFGVWVLATALYAPPSSEIVQYRNVVPEVRYALESIGGIQGVFLEAQKLSAVEDVREETVFTVLPHHTLLSKELSTFWQELAQPGVPSAIVLIGPAHENQGKGTVQLTDGTWLTPNGEVRTDKEMLDQVLRNTSAVLDRDAFQQEHSVGIHMPYISALFPETPVLAVIAPSTSGEAEARAFTRGLHRVLPEGALVVMSVDFSHNLSVEDSDKRDEETLRLIQDRHYGELEKRSPEFFDSPFALISFLLLADQSEMNIRRTWHTNSGTLLNRPDLPGTSYMIWEASSDVELPLTLTIAGDMMLGRQVERWFSATTLEEAYKDVQPLFASSDLAFVNLESVLTDTEPSTGKSIFFKGLPERVDVLTHLDLTYVSVSNNHVDDYGKAGWLDSQKNIIASGVVPVGGYSNDGEVVLAEVRGQTVAFLAFDDTIRRVDLTTLQEKVTDAARRAEHVAVSFHWGVEYVHTPTSAQTNLARAAIDAGADVIIGSHPHVLQTIERYKEGIIFYSLGNIVFDQIGFDENESMVVQLSFSEEGNTAELIPLRIKKGFPRNATDEERTMTLSRLAEWSDAGLKTEIEAGEIVW